MSANLDGLQTAVILVLAVMGAVVDSALNALVGDMVHTMLLLHERIWLIAGISVCRQPKTIQGRRDAAGSGRETSGNVHGIVQRGIFVDKAPDVQ